MKQSYRLRLRCPFDDFYHWTVRKDVELTLQQVYEHRWLFVCPTHGPQLQEPFQAEVKRRWVAEVPGKSGHRRGGMETERFDIFRGETGDRQATWVESVMGIDQARERVQEIAASYPGAYFIFYAPSRAVLGRMNNSPSRAEQQDSAPAKSGSA